MRTEVTWAEELPAAITVTDAAGTIVEMNAASMAHNSWLFGGHISVSHGVATI